MKQLQFSSKFILLFVSLIFIQVKLQAKESQLVQAPIQQVQVFRSQALIQRNIHVELEEGVHRLLIEQVSPYIVNNHVEASIEGGKVLAVQAINDFLNEKTKSSELQQIEDSISQIQTALNELNADLESIQTQKDVLLSNKVIGGTQSGLKADELEDVLLVFQKKMAEFKLEITKINLSKKKLSVLLEKLNQQLNALQEGSVALHNQIAITVQVSGPLAVRNIALQYLVDHVSWQPFYDISVTDANSPAQFVLKAKVYQSTGENWESVQLKLATNDPVVGMEKPALSTQFISFYNPVPMPKMSRAYSAEPAAAAMESKDMRLDNTVHLEQNEIALSFEPTALQTIYSDNKAYPIQLKQFQLPVALQYAAVPKLSDAVYVQAKLPMDELLAQLNAEANIYFNNLFSGTVFIGNTPNDTLELTLGKDQRLNCKRTKVKEQQSKSFFGGTKTESSKYELVVHNASTQTIQVAIEDQIPVSTNKEIVVALKESSGAQIDAEKGQLNWQLHLKPNETIKLYVSFDVSYPSNQQLNPF